MNMTGNIRRPIQRSIKIVNDKTLDRIKVLVGTSKYVRYADYFAEFRGVRRISDSKNITPEEQLKAFEIQLYSIKGFGEYQYNKGFGVFLYFPFSKREIEAYLKSNPFTTKADPYL